MFGDIRIASLHSRFNIKLIPGFFATENNRISDHDPAPLPHVGNMSVAAILPV